MGPDVQRCESIATGYLQHESNDRIDTRDVITTDEWGCVGVKQVTSSRYEYPKILLIHPIKESVVEQYYLREKEIQDVIHDQTPPTAAEDWYWCMSELASMVFGDLENIKGYK